MFLSQHRQHPFEADDTQLLLPSTTTQREPKVKQVQQMKLKGTKTGASPKLLAIGLYCLQNISSLSQLQPGSGSSVKALCVGSFHFTNALEVSREVELDPQEGPFLLVPCTMDPLKVRYRPWWFCC
jgi:hypothetical protein